jgi:hypothetical protein
MKQEFPSTTERASFKFMLSSFKGSFMSCASAIGSKLRTDEWRSSTLDRASSKP